MGSLMAGWDSPVVDPKLERVERNRSLTKEEIDSYWRTKKKTEEEHIRAISDITSPSITERDAMEESETTLEEAIDNGWWTGFPQRDSSDGDTNQQLQVPVPYHDNLQTSR